MYDVITIGSATLDVFVYTDMSDIKKGRQELIAYPVGSKILIKELNFMTGGGGTNTAVSFSRLGLKTAYLGKLGTDDSSEKIINSLKKEKIDFIGPRSREDHTAYSVILDSKQRNRTILTYKGVSNKLKYKEIRKKAKKSGWVYMSSLMGSGFEAQKRLALETKSKVAYNPSEYQIKNCNVKPLVANTDVLIFNSKEANLLTGKKNIKEQMKKLSRMGPEIICITCGSVGDYVYDVNGGNFYSMKPHKIKIKERTGAGDAFASSFVAGLMKGKSIEFSMRLALANSESVIMYHGAKNKLLRYSSALKKMREKPARIKVEKI